LVVSASVTAGAAGNTVSGGIWLPRFLAGLLPAERREGAAVNGCSMNWTASLWPHFSGKRGCPPSIEADSKGRAHAGNTPYRVLRPKNIVFGILF
jgi:hypothetical protein